MSRALAARMLDEFSGRPRRTVKQDELTDREREVLQAVSSRAGNREVAAALNISENTVKFHMKNILDKLR